MASHSDAAAPGLVRDTISYTRLPWIRPLVDAVAHDYGSVASLFPGNPASPAAWRATIDAVRKQSRDHQAMASLLLAQLTGRGAPPAAVDAATRLASPDAVAVVTGQQAGLLGGPLYTLLKAVTTIQMARAASEAHGVPVIPVFWVDSEDHDWNEIRPVHVLDRDHALATTTADDLEGAGSLPVGALTFDARIDQTIDEVASRLAPTEFTDELFTTLRAHYRAGQSPAAAFAGWLDTLLGGEGLVVFDAGDPGAKRLAGRVFQRELERPCETARLARERGERMAAAGHSAQIVPADDVVCLFRLDAAGRTAIRCSNGRFTIGDHDVTADQLATDVADHPENFSPNVLLRPVVQDTLFPTVCYVAGPSELAYHAQLADVYEAFDVARPLLVPRASATLLDAAAARFLDRYEVELEALQVQDESALNRLLERQFPAEVEEAFAETERHIAASAERLASAAAAVDPTLSGAVDTTITRMRDTVRTLQNKIVQASKKKDETLRRQFSRTQALAFPGGQPQERVLNVAFFVNRYGLDLGSRLITLLPRHCDEHYVIVP